MPPVYPLVKVPAAIRGHYQHMAKRDVETWERYLAGPHPDFIAFSYDVAIGGLRPHADTISDTEALGWKYSTALKIDAVAYLPDATWVIEVKPAATVSALGAAIAYTLVADREKVFDTTLVPVIVCDYCQTDVRWAAGLLGVQIIEVGT